MIDLSQIDTYPDQYRMIGSFPDQSDCSDLPDSLRLSDQVDAAIFSSLQESVMTVATRRHNIITMEIQYLLDCTRSTAWIQKRT